MIFFDIDETLFDNRGAQNSAALKLYIEFQELHEIYEESAFPQRWEAVTEEYVQLFLVNKISFQQQRRNRAESAWNKFKRKFMAEMKLPEARRDLDLLAALSHQTNFSIGCYCKDESWCHRSILRELLEQRGANI